MSLLVAEGFDDSPVSGNNGVYLNKRYSSGAVVTETMAGVTRLAGRYHGYGSAFYSGFQGMTWDLPATLGEIFVALAVGRGTATSGTFFAVRDGSTTQVDIRHINGGDLQVTRNGTQLGLLANVFPADVWVWLSVRIVIHATAGIVEVRDAAGTVLLSVTNANTQATANAYVDNLRFPTDSRWADDLFVMDTAGGTFNGHLTERAIRTIFPTGDGSASGWTPNGAVNRYDCIDEVPADEDTTYISSATSGTKNLSTLGDMGASEQGVEAVVWQHRTKKDNVGPRAARGIIRTGGADYAGVSVELAAAYITVADLWETNPATGLAWTPAEVNAIEGGMELVS